MTDQPMSQEDIDALLAGLGGAAPEPAAPQPPPAAPAKPGELMVGQGELDALMAGFDESMLAPGPAAGGTSAPPAAPGPVDQHELDALLDQLEADVANDSASEAAVAPVAAPAMPSGPLGQNDIDQILASLEAGAHAAAPAAASANADSPLGQDGIDALLAGLGGSGQASKSAKAVTNSPARPDAPLGQDGIDALLAGLDNPAPPAGAKPAAPLGQDGIDALLAGLGDARPGATTKPAAPAVAAAPPAAPPVGKLGQDDIDSLLNSLGADTAPLGDVSRKGMPPAAGSLSRATMALSTEDLSSLVNKHTQSGPGEAGEGMIDQQDIDALVKQLGTVTGPPGAAAPTMSQELAKHDAAIDQLLGEARPGPAGSAVTMDAIDVRSVLDKPPSSSIAQMGKGPSYTVNVPVLTPPELRGARWLLAAAVLLLAICAGTLVVVAGAVRTLGSELTHERLSNLEPGDDYGTDYAAAVARLASPDAEQAATGVLFLGRLKKRYPSHEAEIGLTLARHFRAHGAWREAAQQYAEVADDPHTAGDDPRTMVEYADTLRQLDEPDSAKRQLYALLADEAHWTDEKLSAQIAERNRHTLVDAHLLLGRLLNGGATPTLASAEEHSEGAAEGHHAATEAPEGHH